MANAHAHFERGRQLLADRQVKDALHCFDAAQRLGRDANECAAVRWYCWMLAGDFTRALEESDRIAASGAPDPHRFWDGSPWRGRHVMLRCLHGLGDTIQFIRYAPHLRETCSDLTVQTHPQLVTLLQGVPGVDRVISWGPGWPEDTAWDLQLEVNELLRVFRSSLSSIPREIPYICVTEERIHWAAQIIRAPQPLRLGLCWQAGPWDQERSIPFDDLSHLLAQYRFFNLQKGIESGLLIDAEKFASDVRDTAALISNLDLVITVDTLTAHLAGALGRPVWILLPFCADWRWMLQRDDSPWYPTARLFRQQRQGDWATLLAQVAEALSIYAST